MVLYDSAWGGTGGKSQQSRACSHDPLSRLGASRQPGERRRAALRQFGEYADFVVAYWPYRRWDIAKSRDVCDDRSANRRIGERGTYEQGMALSPSKDLMHVHMPAQTLREPLIVMMKSVWT